MSDIPKIMRSVVTLAKLRDQVDQMAARDDIEEYYIVFITGGNIHLVSSEYEHTAQALGALELIKAQILGDFLNATESVEEE